MSIRLSSLISRDIRKALRFWQDTAGLGWSRRVSGLVGHVLRVLVLRVERRLLPWLSQAPLTMGYVQPQHVPHRLGHRLYHRLRYVCARWLCKVLSLCRLVRRQGVGVWYRTIATVRRLRAAVRSTVHTYKSKVMQSYGKPLKLVYPINLLLSYIFKHIKYKNSVLHISYMVHIPYYATRVLRKHGMKADYLAMERNPVIWDKSDYLFIPPPIPLQRAWQEFLFFWTVVARYEVIHSHFAMMLSDSGWELPFLKRMGRKIVIHYRGCEIRNREKNMALHPEVNICQACDYNAEICRDPTRRQRCALGERYGDLFLVTTPDMQDFVPEAIHFPFFAPEINYEAYAAQRQRSTDSHEIKIVHVTGHPGIEGTELIRKAFDRLKDKGYPIHFDFLHRVHHDRVLQEMASADLTIGKMKMGYYANAQIESMFLGVPAITYVRPEFMTPELEASGFIFTTLRDLETTLEYYLTHPDELEKKRQIARSSILRLHDNDALGKRLMDLYARAKMTRG